MDDKNLTSGSDGGTKTAAPCIPVSVSLSDFPEYDGSSDPETFIKQCRRVATLGRIDDKQLATILAARCRGLALQAIETKRDQGDIIDVLEDTFGAKQRSQAAATQLSTFKKLGMPVSEYSVKIRALVTDACPEMFDSAGCLKKICVPAYEAALYRHVLIGLSESERLLLSRQGAVTFRKAVDELMREEAVSETSAEFRRSAAESLEVSWADPVAAEAGASGSGSGRVEARAARRWRPRSSPPGSESAGGRRVSSWHEDDTDSEDSYTDSAAGMAGGGESGWRRRGQSSPGGRQSSRTRQGRSPSPRRWWGDRGGPRSPRPGPRVTSYNRRGQGRSPSPRPGQGDRGVSPSPRAGPRDRRSPPPQQVRRQPRCWSCRGYGHLKASCPNEQGGAGRQRSIETPHHTGNDQRVRG